MRRLTSRQPFLQFIVGTGIFSAAIACLFSLHAFAVTKPLTGFDPSASSGLEISPALIELNGDRGKTYQLRLKVHNVTNVDLSYTSSVADFAAKDETGSPKQLTIGQLPITASMVTWVSVPGQFSLKRQETRTINIDVTVPQNAESGGHYGVINFIGKDPQSVNNAINVRVSTGLLVLAKVPGTVDEKLTLASLTAEQSGHQSWFFEKAPVTFVTRLKNEGNVHVKPTGTLEIRDTFGGLVSLLQVNEKTANVLPNSVRRFESVLNKDWMIGRYVASLTIGYGTKGQVVTSQITFWVIPYKILIVLLFILVTLAFIVRGMLKVYNRKVIRKYQKTNEQQKPKKS